MVTLLDALSGRERLGPSAQEPGRSSGGKVLVRPRAAAVIRGLLFLGFILSTFPYLMPYARTAGLDPSWIEGINEAAHRGMVFGREVAFTYGPLGFLFFPLDLGHNFHLALGFTLTLFPLWWLAVALNASRCRHWAVYMVFLAVNALVGVHLYPGLVLLSAVLGFLCYSRQKESWGWAVPAAGLAGVALLTKWSIGMGAAATLGIWACLWVGRRPMPAGLLQAGLPLAFAGACFTGLFLVWGGPPAALLPYLKYSLLISEGYSSQMCVEVPAWELNLALVQIGLLGALVLFGARKDRRYLLLGFLVSAALFVMFKNGFVRGGGYNSYLFLGMAAVAAGFFLLLPRGRWETVAVTLAVLAVFLVVGGWKRALGFPAVDVPVQAGWSRLLALVDWPARSEVVARHTEESRRRQCLPPELLARIGREPVDAYPWDISVPLANGLNWRPRPVFQSYSAYTPELDAVNARHYEGPQAPTFVLYGHKAIDGQSPSLVDPRTWLELLRWYDLDSAPFGSFPIYGEGGETGAMLLLRRRQTPRTEAPCLLGEQTLQVGERWPVPLTPSPLPPRERGRGEGAGPRELILLRAQFRLRAKGLVNDFLFKNDPPQIQVEYTDGTSRGYRLAWRNAANGFLVSDIPQDLDRVRSLWTAGAGSPVKAITFDANPHRFQDRIAVQWFRLPYRDGQRPSRE